MRWQAFGFVRRAGWKEPTLPIVGESQTPQTPQTAAWLPGGAEAGASLDSLDQLFRICLIRSRIRPSGVFWVPKLVQCVEAGSGSDVFARKQLPYSPSQNNECHLGWSEPLPLF